MTQAENLKHSYKGGSSSTVGKSALPQAQKSVYHARRGSFIRKIVTAVLLTLVLILLFFIGREWIQRNEYQRTMHQLGEHIADFRKTSQTLPTREQMLKFPLQSRIGLERLTYEPERILNGSLPDTLLAYSPRLNFTFLTSGYAVLDFNGQVSWLDDAQLAEKIRGRDRHYNAAILQEKTLPKTTSGTD